MHHPSADQQCSDDLKMAAKVHQEIHRKLEFVYPHVEFEHPVDPSGVGHVPLTRRWAQINCADAELPQNPDARAGATVYRTLHQRHTSCGKNRANAAAAIHLSM